MFFSSEAMSCIKVKSHFMNSFRGPILCETCKQIIHLICHIATGAKWKLFLK